LITLAKGKPFGFLDHNLRSGDSLLGIHKLSQLTKFSLKDEDNLTLSLFFSSIENTVSETIHIRKKLRMTPIRDIRDVQYMEGLDKQARKKIEKVGHIADAIIGETLAYGDKEKKLKAALDILSIWSAGYIDGKDKEAKKIIDEARKSLSVGLPSGKQLRKPFHWALEFPEVFEGGGFDGIVGNPPFMGGQKITGNLSVPYRNFLVVNLANGKRGSADLCTYFFLRNASLLANNGHAGLLATNTIAQGDTREIGLQQLEEFAFSFPNAISGMKWPGKANLEISIVWFFKGQWTGRYTLDGRSVLGISSYLHPPGIIVGSPYRLKRNKNISFIGSYVLGDGFILEPEEAKNLINKNPKNKEVLSPYLNGKDLNTCPTQSPSRWAINFYDWPLCREEMGQSWMEASNKERKELIRNGIVPSDYPDPVAMDYPDCFDIVERLVKLKRLKNNRKVYRERWWQYAEKRPDLYSIISKMDRYLVHPLTSKYHNLIFYKKGIICSHMTVVLPVEDWNMFTVLQSEFNWIWALFYGNKLETRPQYTPSDCVETFPFPKKIDGLGIAGKKFYERRQNIMQNSQEGLTKMYNRFHNPKIISEDIVNLRQLQIIVDKTVSTAYTWDDLDLKHSFQQTKQGIRFTISEESRHEILQRLLKLNHERYEEEVNNGLYVNKKPTKSRNNKTAQNANSQQVDLFNFSSDFQTK
jgi:hypothetical protein